MNVLIHHWGWMWRTATELLDLLMEGLYSSGERENGSSCLESRGDHKNVFLCITFLRHNALIYRSLICVRSIWPLHGYFTFLYFTTKGQTELVQTIICITHLRWRRLLGVYQMAAPLLFTILNYTGSDSEWYDQSQIPQYGHVMVILVLSFQVLI